MRFVKVGLVAPALYQCSEYLSSGFVKLKACGIRASFGTRILMTRLLSVVELLFLRAALRGKKHRPGGVDLGLSSKRE